jgi:hypothetical protein
MRDWELNQPLRNQTLAELKGEIDKGLADVKAGRVKSFDADAIIQQAKRRLAGHNSRSAYSGDGPGTCATGARPARSVLP